MRAMRTQQIRIAALGAHAGFRVFLGDLEEAEGVLLIHIRGRRILARPLGGLADVFDDLHAHLVPGQSTSGSTGV
jgi:hypothetical protein